MFFYRAIFLSLGRAFNADGQGNLRALGILTVVELLWYFYAGLILNSLFGRTIIDLGLASNYFKFVVPIAVFNVIIYGAGQEL